MTDHANELRRYSRKIGRPAGDVPSVMLAAAEEIERLAARLEAAEKERDLAKAEIARLHDDIRELTDVRVLDAEDRDRIVALQRVNGKTPHQLRAEAEQERDALRAKIEQMEKRLRPILEEPENTMSNSKALREVIRQAKLALKESK